MLKDKPVLSNQHGALVMAFVPYLYGIFASHFTLSHLWLGLSWLFLYLCSYPFLSLFSKKNRQKYQKWTLIYGIISLFFALPLLWQQPKILQFLVPFSPLVWVQIHYAKLRNERHLCNDIAGILIFGIVGMASYYLATERYNLAILLHPTLFFIATTLYIKSVARERKNPRYKQLSLLSHLLLGLIYLGYGQIGMTVAYLVGLIRAIVIPKQKWTIKQVGMLEFAVTLVLLVGLACSVVF